MGMASVSSRTFLYARCIQRGDCAAGTDRTPVHRGNREPFANHMSAINPRDIESKEPHLLAQFVVSDSAKHIAVSADARRVSQFVFVLLFAFYLLVLLASQGGAYFLQDADIYWHIAVGRDIWQSGVFPQYDEFSYTFRGQPWIANQWLAELFLSGAYALAGWRSVLLLTASTIAFSYALLFLVLSRKMRLTAAAGMATAAYSFSLGHFGARPQIFADPLIILWVAGLVHAAGNRISPSWLLLPVIGVWANLHGSFSFGLAIGAAFAAEATYYSQSGERFRTARRWAIFLAAALGVACVTPYGYRPILVTLQVFGGNEALSHIGEWQPVTLQSFGVNEVFVFGLLFMAMYHGLRVPAWRLLTIIAVIYMMFAHVRFASLFAILTPILLATPIARQFPFLSLSAQLRTEPQFFERMARVSRAAFYPVCAIIVAGIACFGAYGAPASPKANITPAGAVDYMMKEHLTGNVYNFYDFGGYLIFRGIKTFIDGRSDQLFVHGFTSHLYEVLDRHPRKFLELLSKYDASIALVVPDSIESQELASSREWEKVYSDEVSELFKKHG
jgi:hypothetical protein